MLKNKRILLIIMLALVLFLIPSVSNAVDTFTTENGIVVKKVVTGFTNGSIELKISNINLNSEGNYAWGISQSSSIESITKWYVLGDINASKKTASLNLTVQDNNILALLRKTNRAYLFIKDTKLTDETMDDTLVIDGLQVDLTLPPLYAFDYTIWLDSYYIIGGSSSLSDHWDGATYNIKNAHYKFEKITDEALVSKYKQALLDGTNLTDVFSINASTVENIENWTACTKDNNYPFTKIDKTKVPTDQGAYYLWIKAKDADSKTVYGCLIVNIDADGPTVEKIYVSSPESGTYKTGQTVKIRVGFSEPIVGSTVPTLKIKFGDSANREISNGTIVNSGDGDYYWQHYIEYSYDIQDSDKGQLATVELTGGNIKDSSNNEASLSCPVLTGNTIKANVEGTNNNQTDNLDKDNNMQTPLSSISITKVPTKVNYTEGEKFDASGMVITATYSDGTTKQITNYTVSPAVELKVEDKHVIITYTENGVTKTIGQSIAVTSKTNSTITLTSIKITKAPTKTKYTEGEKFNASGMVITATYSDGSTKQITNYTVSPVETLKITNKKVTVTYTENGVTKTVEQTISVAKDTTTKGDNKLPQTGTTLLSLVLVSLIVVAVISKVKYGKFKDI